ncbi:hypothetical protein [Bordetella sp. BOR01]|uniref:hypothetical protein n=1 Tax=Bordetella sp. BOR01 TaxID=2854779 RepID=UPI001C439DC3|nr:hypothetical protein [Bordetella sp. BOR01]MBV7485208.1 hypothetical protein [Bordetella sp. BOR01]
MASPEQDNPTQNIIDRAEQAVQEAQRSLEKSDDALRALGLDPAKVKSVLQAQPLTDAQRDEAEKLFRQDMEDIEREVTQESAYARQRSTARTTTPGKRPRTMV